MLPSILDCPTGASRGSKAASLRLRLKPRMGICLIWLEKIDASVSDAVVLIAYYRYMRSVALELIGSGMHEWGRPAVYSDERYWCDYIAKMGAVNRFRVRSLPSFETAARRIQRLKRFEMQLNNEIPSQLINGGASTPPDSSCHTEHQHENPWWKEFSRTICC